MCDGRAFRLGIPLLLVLLSSAQPVWAHGVVGQRFFPATLAIDDPFVADELSLPTVQTLERRASAEAPRTQETTIEAELSKRLSPNLGLTLAGALDVLAGAGGPTLAGFENLAVGAKYVFLKSDRHELLLSAGLEASVGGTGMRKVGAESFSTLTPGWLFGWGLGELPDSLWYLKPFALTGAFGVEFPTQEWTTTRTWQPDGALESDRTRNPRTLDWGLTLQYSLQYLQSFVRDVGLPAPFDRMIPVVELPLETTLQGGTHTTGSVNPGVIWFGRFFQIGVEAVLPIHGNGFDQAKQNGAGFLGQIHFYLDDIWPEGFTWTPFHGALGPTQPR